MCLDSRCPISSQLEIHACVMLMSLMKYDLTPNSRPEILFVFCTLIQNCFILFSGPCFNFEKEDFLFNLSHIS
jgi:hypothetical protein